MQQWLDFGISRLTRLHQLVLRNLDSRLSEASLPISFLVLFTITEGVGLTQPLESF
jgi:hypothetical protein